MDTDTGPADYMLFIDSKACGIVETKQEGSNLGDVDQQSHRYAVSGTRFIQRCAIQLPFTYEATNYEIRFCYWCDLYARLRYLFHFRRPETLLYWREQEDSFNESREDSENQPGPEGLAQEVVEQLEAALEEFRSVEEVLADTK